MESAAGSDAILTIGDVATALGSRIPAATSEATPVLGASIDSRCIRPGELFFALPGQRTDGVQFVRQALDAGACAAIVPQSAKGMGGMAVDDVASALWTCAHFARHKFAREFPETSWIALTGSVGKTTTRQLLAALLCKLGPTYQSPANYNNALGVPLTILGAQSNHRFVVVEVGTSAAGEIEALGNLVRPDGVVITAIERAHLAGLKTLERVRDEKLSLLKVVAPSGWAVIPDDLRFGDDAACMWNALGHQRDSFSRAETANTIAMNASGSTLSIGRNTYSLDLHGLHLRSLVPLAIAAVERAAHRPLSLAQISAGLKDMSASPGRCHVKRIAGRTMIDDSYNANPKSVRAACELLAAFPTNGRRFALLGDMLDLGDNSVALHHEVGNAIPSTIDMAYAVGDYATAWGPNVTACTTQREAVAAIVNESSHDDVVLVKGSRAMRMEEAIDLFSSAVGR